MFSESPPPFRIPHIQRSCAAASVSQAAITPGGRPAAGKSAARRVLALLAVMAPDARPSRGTLKQVMLFFGGRAPGGDDGGGARGDMWSQ